MASKPKTQEFAAVRRWQRLPLTIPIFLRGTDEKGNGFLDFAKGLNISGGGALVLSRRYLPPNTLLNLEIPSTGFSDSDISTPAATQNLPSRLVRVANSAEYFLLGLEFSNPLVAAAEEANRPKEGREKRTSAE